MKDNKQPVQGQEKHEVNLKLIEEQEALIRSQKEEEAKNKLDAMNALDSIPFPIICTVVIPPSSFHYRNLAFWQQFKEKDETTRQLLVEFLNENEKA